ncbi:MAG: periplasmic/7TM domain sensor diguanylate cyclase [Rhizobacter sp.]|nr:periplasmic/7TM domain sensor diguanylate cyclase [Rhizobacter sp.]
MWSPASQQFLERCLGRLRLLACSLYGRRVAVVASGLLCLVGVAAIIATVAMPRWIASIDDSTARATASGPATAVLHRETEYLDLWPAVRTLAEEGGRWDVDEALRRLGEFTPPASPHANLGIQASAIWLKVKLASTEGAASRWVLEIDYPLMNRIDAYVVTDGHAGAPMLMGNAFAFMRRPLPSRTHAGDVQLDPGHQQFLLVRVQTHGSMIVPLGLYSPRAFLLHEARQNLLQGVMAGLALCLLVGSLTRWLTSRDAVFLFYSMVVLGSTFYAFAYYGVGPQHLWPEVGWLEVNAAVLSAHLALAGACFFIDRLLAVRDWSRRSSAALRITGVCAVLTCIGLMAGLLDYRVAEGLAAVMTPIPMLLSIPAAVVRHRQGDRSAVFILMGWGFYTAGVLISVGLLGGKLPANFWTQHAYQFTGLVEMTMWMHVLGVRMEATRTAAQRALVERDSLVALAYTDPLTGLPNRRGLNERLALALAERAPDKLLAVFLLDLDGFKAINDRFGHDAGDRLLALVAQRLRGLFRSSDVVARLGGDEFVVMAAGIGVSDDALHLGHKVLEAFTRPFDVNGQECRVGVTVGYAIAPVDANEASALLRSADAAMYEGKQNGRHTVRRASAAKQAG